MTLDAPARRVLRSWLAMLTPPPKRTVAEWADGERVLSMESAAEPGPWRTSRAEYQRGFLEAFSDPNVRELVGVWASQVGKTDSLLNMIGSRIDANPGPMLMIQPTLTMAEAWSKDRLAPMLRDTPCLRGKVRDARSRDSGNTVLHKQFPGGHITIAGSNSAASLAMRPIRDVYFDEEDRYAPSAGTEGDAVKLAETRTRAFWNAKKVHISSPGIRGASRIEIVWMRSDQRYYYVPCHACGARQTLKWTQVAWEKDPDTGEHRPETARYVCDACGEPWSDVQRRAAVRRGEWRATRPFRGCAGFHINALAAPWESCNLEHLVRQWLEAQGNPELLKVFVNTVLAEWWEDSHFTKTVDETGLLSRREELEEIAGRPAIPAPCALVTAGVDIQDSRAEVSIYAWGKGEEAWLLEHRFLYGDPSTAAFWEDLDRYLLLTWPRSAGGIDFVRGIAVDTGGHHTAATYDFCGPRFRRSTADGGRQFVFAVKGMAGSGELWPKAASKASAKVPLWPIRVDAGKEQVYGRLGIAEPGPGYIHLPRSVDVEFMRGLTAERVVTRLDKKGFPRRSWEKKPGYARNEPLDCAVYAYAALVGLRAMGFDLDAEIEQLKSRPVIEADRIAPPAVPQRPMQEPSGVSRYEPAENNWLGDTRNWLR